MSIRLDEPAWILLLPLLLPLIWRIGRRSLAGLSRMRGILALGLRIFLISALVFALARPQWNSASDAVTVYFVVDQSSSIPNDRIGDLHDYLQETSKTKPSSDLTGLIYFGADAACEQPPSELPLPKERQSVVDRDGTDIAEALRLAASTFPSHARKRVILVSDGNQNLGDAVGETERLRSQGIQTDVLPVEYAYENEILVEKAVLPDQVQQGIPAELRILVRSTHDTDASLVVRRGGLTVGQEKVRLKTGRNHFSLPVVVDDREKPAGVRTFEVGISATRPQDDHIHDNNMAYAFTCVAGPPSVLYIDGNIGFSKGYIPLLHEALLKRLHLVRSAERGDSPEITLKLCDAYGIPEDSELASYDCIVIDNLAAEYLGPYRMERIRALVSGQGTGLVMIGGENSFGAGNYRNTPLEDALPVDMDLKNKKVTPNGALLLVVDRSGSMEGDKLAQAKAAAWAAVKVLSPSDYIGIIAFDGKPNWLVEPILARDRYAIRRKISTLGSGGGTDIMGALREACAALAPIRATLKHVVILSDGQSDNRGFEELMGAAKKNRITVSSVGIGEKGGQKFMQEIANYGGGRFYYVTDPSMLPRIFIKESIFVKKVLLFEETFTPNVTNRYDEFLGNIDLKKMPPLHGYVATTAKSAASVPLVSTNDNKDPVLAHWRYGLGRSVAFTSDAKNRWGKEWLEWGDFANFWSGLVYRIMRQEPSNLRLTTSIEGSRGSIVAHALNEHGDPMPFLELSASITGPDSRVKRLRLRQNGVCTYEGAFEADKPGRYEVAVIESGGSGKSSCAAYGGVSKPFSAESTDLSADMKMLHHIARTGGGHLLSGKGLREDAFRRDGLMPAIHFRDCWTALLALAAFFLPLDVFVRRVKIDYNFEAVRFWMLRRYYLWRNLPLPREDDTSRRSGEGPRAYREPAAPLFPETIGGERDFGAINSGGVDIKSVGTEGVDTELADSVSLDSELLEDGDKNKPSPSAVSERSDQPAQKAPSAEDDSYTGRLLRAKRRGRDRYNRS